MEVIWWSVCTAVVGRACTHRGLSHQIAETLYNKGFLSYPRTETQKFKEGTDLVKLLDIQKEHPRWGEHAQRYPTL